MWAGWFPTSVYLPTLLLFLRGSEPKKAAQPRGESLPCGLCCFHDWSLKYRVCVEGVCHFDDYVSSIALSEESLLVYQYEPRRILE